MVGRGMVSDPRKPCGKVDLDLERGTPGYEVYQPDIIRMRGDCPVEREFEFEC